MKIIDSAEFDSYWEEFNNREEDEKLEAAVMEIISVVRLERDAALRRYASLFDKSSPRQFEVPVSENNMAYIELRKNNPELAAALELSARNILKFSQKQKEQVVDFTYEIDKGLAAGQRVIPVERAAVYVPGGRFPLISTVLMGLIPAFCAGVEEVILVSPPMEDGLPDRRILAAAEIAMEAAGRDSRLRVFAIGGAHAIAALALGTESVPRVDVIAGPGNKYVTMAKRLLFGRVGIDFAAGPTDVLIIADGTPVSGGAADYAAADMIAQAEHDSDARARALVPRRGFAELIEKFIQQRLETLPTAEIVRSSLDSGAVFILYNSMEEAVRIANKIAPEHLELQIMNADKWIPFLKNYGSLFIGGFSAEVLGDYTAGINHTLPTSGGSRFSSGLSVRHFLKTPTILRCEPGDGYSQALRAAQCIAMAEGLEGHARSAAIRL